jgi:hypothetical protein
MAIVEVGSAMPDETKPMTAVAIDSKDRLKPELQQGVALTVWVQRGLLGVLAVGHYLLPFLFAQQDNELVRDSVLLGQVTILMLLVALGGLHWWALIALVLVYPIPAIMWFLSYPEYLREYAGVWLLPYCIISALTLGVLRVFGYRGVWDANEAAEPRPLQISIRGLLILTTLVAATLAFTNWLRLFESSGIGQDLQLWLNVTVDGVVTAVLTALLGWGVGRRGTSALRFTLLLLALLFLTGCQIYAFQMESFWHLPALMSIAWTMVTVGTLLVWRVCGWHVVVRQRDGSFA